MEKVHKKKVNVPMIMQMEALECGAACLSMIMAYYGKWVPLEKVRVDCGVSRDGSNARNILLAARNYGLAANGYRFDPEELVKSGSFPCIIHWEFNHFIVLDGFRGNFAYINDPARGKLKLSMEEFDKGFTGICLMFEPTEAFEKGGSRKSTIQFARERLTGAGPIVAFVISATILAYMLNVLKPAFNRFFMDKLLTGENRELLSQFVILLSVVAGLSILVAAINEIYSLKITGKMAVIGSSSYMWKVLHLPMEFFSQRFAGDILQRKDANATISKTIVDVLAPLLLNAFMMFFYLIFLLRYSVVLTILGISTIIINAFLGRVISQKKNNIMMLRLRDMGKLQSTALSGVRMIETIKSSGAEAGFFKKWAGYQALAYKEKIEYSHINIMLGLLPELFNKLTGYLVFAMGINLVMNGQFTLGMVTSFTMYLQYFVTPAMSVVKASQDIQEMRSNMERLDDVMKYQNDSVFETLNIEEDGEFSKLKGNVSIKNITFGYSRLGAPVIEDFSLDIESGSKIAIVGASGCGKSTISKLISGLYKPWSGEITFDGKKISEINRNVFTGSVAVVDQDITMFKDTIDQNIKLWDNSIEDFEVILAARDARIHDEIMERPEGYKAMIGEDGNNFSGGQKQRLEIARVLSQDPSIIILDEATSALDSVTEKEVVDSIKKRGITCIVIAHRLSTIRDCEKIVVLDKGHIVGVGTHNELMDSLPYYKELVISE